MAIYYYRAKTDPKNVVEGEVEASTKEAALKKIEEMGYFPVKVEERIHRGEFPSRFLLKRASLSTIIVFTKQLAILIKSGVPVLRALEIVSSQMENNFFKSVVIRLHSEIKEGQNLSSALAKFPSVFSNFYISMVKAGEDTGKLEDVLLRIAAYYKNQEEIFSKVKIALVYPMIMLFVGIGTVVFMLSFVVPKLINIFSDLGSRLPLPTQILIALSSFLRERWLIIVISLCALIFIYLRQGKKKEIKTFLSVLSLRLPVIRGFVFKKDMAILSRTLEILIKSGIPILKALRLTIPILNNELIKKEFLKSAKDLEEGASLGVSLGKSSLFPSFVTCLISVGEESGRLDEALGELANIYEEELKEGTKVFTTILEPLMILIMGSLVGFIVMAMLLPIFQINIMVR